MVGLGNEPRRALRASAPFFPPHQAALCVAVMLKERGARGGVLQCSDPSSDEAPEISLNIRKLMIETISQNARKWVFLPHVIWFYEDTKCKHSPQL